MINKKSQYPVNKKLLQSVSKAIFENRSKLSMTQEEIANLANTSWRYFQKIESSRNSKTADQIQNISLSVFVDIANAINISPGKLLDEAIKNANN
ncbi:helix-turn-helix domain-containing protein [Candidatus Margulisiibacteriota bacterium]